MNTYITGNFIKKLREEKNMTQAMLADILNVSDKTISKWETGKGYPDITLIEPLSKALNVSIMELLSGNDITNVNRSFNMLKAKFYVCPICGNIIYTSGETLISCCGITLPPLEPEEIDKTHNVTIEPIEDEINVTIKHPMTKEHYISFICGISDLGVELVKLYPEGGSSARFKRRRNRFIYFYCNRDGLFKLKL